MGQRFRWVGLLMALLLGACGRAEQAGQQPSPVPLSPLPSTAEVATATPGARATQSVSWPTPDDVQRALTITVAAIETNAAEFRNRARATNTAQAAWAQTPEPTILPAPGYAVLRDIWPAGPQQATAPTRLYLRSPSFSEWEPDLFWEVRLPDAQLRRLPAVEHYSLGDTALVSPDGRFLAYITGSPPTLRLLDLASDANTGIAVPVSNGQERCQQSIAWSPSGRTLAVRDQSGQHPDWTGHILLFDPQTSTTPQPFLQLPGLLELLGWLDEERLLLVQWSYKLAEPARLLVVDRQGNQTLIRTLKPGTPSCSSLSPDGRDLIYEHDWSTYRVQLATGEQQPFSTDPDTFFWVGDGRTLLVSPFNRDRTVWLRPLDQPEQQRNLFLSPPYQSDYRFGITGVSPDGSLLVACEQPSGDNPRIRSNTARTWLYDIAQDRWTHIRDNARGGCDRVLGWSTLGATQ